MLNRDGHIPLLVHVSPFTTKLYRGESRRKGKNVVIFGWDNDLPGPIHEPNFSFHPNCNKALRKINPACAVMDGRYGETPVSVDVAYVMADDHGSQTFMKIKSPVEGRRYSPSPLINEKEFLVQTYPCYALVERICMLELKRNDDFPVVIHIAPFAILYSWRQSL